MIISIEFLHSKGIFHKDLKPENLVFDDKGYLRVTDLGLASVSSTLDISGSPGYTAPEVYLK